MSKPVFWPQKTPPHSPRLVRLFVFKNIHDPISSPDTDTPQKHRDSGQRDGPVGVPDARWRGAELHLAVGVALHLLLAARPLKVFLPMWPILKAAVLLRAGSVSRCRCFCASAAFAGVRWAAASLRCGGPPSDGPLSASALSAACQRGVWPVHMLMVLCACARRRAAAAPAWTLCASTCVGPLRCSGGVSSPSGRPQAASGIFLCPVGCCCSLTCSGHQPPAPSRSSAPPTWPPSP